MINKSKVALITAILLLGFASPVFADCLESGAAESCGSGSQVYDGTYGRGYYDYAPEFGRYNIGHRDRYERFR